MEASDWINIQEKELFSSGIFVQAMMVVPRPTSENIKPHFIIISKEGTRAYFGETNVSP